MASIKIANKNFMSQSGNDEPAITSNVTFPAGHIIQIVQATKTETETFNNENWTTAISSLNPSFVTKKANSKVLLQTCQHWGSGIGDAEGVGVRLYRNDGTGYAEVTAARKGGGTTWTCFFNVPGLTGDNYAPHGVTASFLDSPSVAAGTTLTYAFHPRPYSSGYPVYLNKGQSFDNDTNGRWQPLTSATIMEIAT